MTIPPIGFDFYTRALEDLRRSRQANDPRRIRRLPPVTVTAQPPEPDPMDAPLRAMLNLGAPVVQGTLDATAGLARGATRLSRLAGLPGDTPERIGQRATLASQRVGDVIAERAAPRNAADIAARVIGSAALPVAVGVANPVAGLALTGAMSAGNRNQSGTAALADATGNATLRRVADVPGTRALSDVALDRVADVALPLMGGMLRQTRPRRAPSGRILPPANDVVAGTIGGAAGLAVDQDGEINTSDVLRAGLGAAAGVAGGRAIQGARQWSASRAGRESLERQSAGPTVDIDFDGSITKASTVKPWSERARNFIDSVADRQRPLDRVGEAMEQQGTPITRSPRRFLNRALSSDDAVNRALKEGVPDFATRESLPVSYASVFGPLGRNPAKVREALQFAVESRLVGRGADAFRGDTERLANAQANVARLAQNPENVAFTQRLEQYVDALGKYAVDSGLWTPDQWQAFKASDAVYIPFRRILQGVGTGKGMGRPRDMKNVGDGVKRFKGARSLPLSNPAEALADYTASVIRRADAYAVGASLFDNPEVAGLRVIPATDPRAQKAVAAEAAASEAASAAGHPVDPKAASAATALHWRPSMSDERIIWKNNPDGTKTYAIVENAGLLNALEGLDAQTALPVLGTLKRIVTATATGINPRFSFATAPARDLWDVFTKNRGVTLGDLAVGYREAFRQVASELTGGRISPSGLADAFGAEGLSGTSIYAHRTNPERIAHELAPTSVGQLVATPARAAFSAPLRALERAGAATDLAPRLAVGRAAARRAAAGGADDVEQRVAGALAGAQATVDFRRTASDPTAAFLERTVPYFGAAMRSTVRWARAAKDDPKRVLAMQGLGATAAALAWALRQDDAEEAEEATDRPVTERASNLVFSTGRGQRPVKLPIPQELGPVVAATNLALSQLSRDDPNAAQVLRQSLLRMLPPGISEVTETATSPDLQGPADVLASIPRALPGIGEAVDVAANRGYGNRPIVPRDLAELPAPLRDRGDNPAVYQVAAAGARRMGLENTDAIALRYMARGMLGATEPLIAAAAEPVARALGGREAQPTVPVGALDDPLNPASAFVGRRVPATSEAEVAYYRMRDEVKRLMQGGRAVGKRLEQGTAVERDGDGLAEARQRLQERYGITDPQAMLQAIESTDEQIAAMRTMETAVRNAVAGGLVVDGRRVTAADARRVLDNLRAQRFALFRDFMGAARSAREDQ